MVKNSGQKVGSGNFGLYKTLSGLLSSNKLSVLSHKQVEELRMIAGESAQDKHAPYWWPFVANKPRSSTAPAATAKVLSGVSTGERRRSDSATLLTTLVQQSLELSKCEDKRRQLVTYEFTNLAGFMEYDPKTAAKLAYKRNGRGAHKLGMDWFRT